MNQTHQDTSVVTKRQRMILRAEKARGIQYSVVQSGYLHVIVDDRIREMHGATVHVMSRMVYEASLLANITFSII